MQNLVHFCMYYLMSVYLTNASPYTLRLICLCVRIFCTRVCVCHQTRQCMMLSAAEDMRTPIYNSTLSQLRHTVLPHGAGACLCVCVSAWWRVHVCLCVCNRVGNLRVGDCECDRQSERGERTVNDRLRVHVRACVFVCVGPAEGVSEKQRHVTLNKGEMRGYDWLFSDVTDCEPSQLETIIRSLVTPSASSPLLYPIFPLFCLSALHPNFLPLCL